MKCFLDTSVLIAAFYGDHQHHQRSLELLAGQKKGSACTAAHCLAEVYAVATGMPGKNRASPSDAILFVRDIRERLSTMALDTDEYAEVLEEAAASGILGGTIYDALIARCALKAKTQAVYTWNSRHFTKFDSLASRVKEP